GQGSRDERVGRSAQVGHDPLGSVRTARALGREAAVVSKEHPRAREGEERVDEPRFLPPVRRAVDAGPRERQLVPPHRPGHTTTVRGRAQDTPRWCRAARRAATYPGRVTRSPFALAALATAAIPGLDAQD